MTRNWAAFGRYFRLASASTASMLACVTVMAAQPDEDRQIADSMAAMLRAGRVVISRNQQRINDPSLGAKGLDGQSVLAQTIVIYKTATGIDPLTLDPTSRHGRLLGEEMAAIKEVMDANRSSKARPDAWETEVIDTKFSAPGWTKGQSFEANFEQQGHTEFRIAVPEYYAASCLSCHGGPRGETDLTGYPKEGAALGDLGGVISIRLTK